MAAKWIQQKRRYRQYKARTERLPASYRTAIDAIERYTHYFPGPGTGESVLAMLEDLIDLFEQSAASGTPVREANWKRLAVTPAALAFMPAALPAAYSG